MTGRLSDVELDTIRATIRRRKADLDGLRPRERAYVEMAERLLAHCEALFDELAAHVAREERRV